MRGRFFFGSDANRVERALVFYVLARNPFGNRLHAFEAAGRIKVQALFAGMQLEAAFGTFFGNFGDRRQHRPTLGTPGNRALAGHLQGPGTKGVFLCRTVSGPFAGSLRPFTAILVSVLSVLPFGQRLTPLAGTLSR